MCEVQKTKKIHKTLIYLLFCVTIKLGSLKRRKGARILGVSETTVLKEKFEDRKQ
jgi:hypothetical protein